MCTILCHIFLICNFISCMIMTSLNNGYYRPNDPKCTSQACRIEFQNKIDYASFDLHSDNQTNKIVVCIIVYHAMFPLKLGNRGKYCVIIQEYLIIISEYYINSYSKDSIFSNLIDIMTLSDIRSVSLSVCCISHACSLCICPIKVRLNHLIVVQHFNLKLSSLPCYSAKLVTVAHSSNHSTHQHCHNSSHSDTCLIQFCNHELRC